MMTVLRFDDDRGGLAYPFLPDEWQWQIVSRPFGDEDALATVFQAETPALRWVKDDKVLDLYVPGMDSQAFLERTGLQLSMAKGGYVLSKRLSRVMRPYRYWSFFQAGEVTIHYDESLDGRLWDGCGLVSPRFIQKLAANPHLNDRQRQALLHSGRFEVTTLHEGGQDKGHVLVSPRAAEMGYDFIFPTGSAKTELRLGETAFGPNVFVGLNLVHSEDQMCLDVQSLINLYPFFKREHLLHWAQLESELFLSGIKSGQLAAVLGRLYDESDLENLADWHVGEFLAGGGSLMWFAGMVKAVAKQHLNRLGSRAGKLRCPAPAGRYYIFPAAVGGRDVPEGYIELDPATATAWVNDSDWLTYIVDVLGGCDGDDAVWVFPFSDVSDNGRRKLLIWRSPNQVGEYVVLQPTANSRAIEWDIGNSIAGNKLSYPKMQSRLLPNRIDSCHYQYGQLTEASDSVKANASYSRPTTIRITHHVVGRHAPESVIGMHRNTQFSDIMSNWLLYLTVRPDCPTSPAPLARPAPARKCRAWWRRRRGPRTPAPLRGAHLRAGAGWRGSGGSRGPIGWAPAQTPSPPA
jgi:hypothetical protein